VESFKLQTLFWTSYSNWTHFGRQ